MIYIHAIVELSKLSQSKLHTVFCDYSRWNTEQRKKRTSVAIVMHADVLVIEKCSAQFDFGSTTIKNIDRS